MSNALGRAAAELKDEIEKHDIKVFEHERRISWRGIDKCLPYGTRRSEWRRNLKKIIRASERMEAHRRQATLL